MVFTKQNELSRYKKNQNKMMNGNRVDYLQNRPKPEKRDNYSNEPKAEYTQMQYLNFVLIFVLKGKNQHELKLISIPVKQIKLQTETGLNK